jgi:ribosome-associated translation inhibitor RaiA
VLRAEHTAIDLLAAIAGATDRLEQVVARNLARRREHDERTESVRPRF